MILSVYIVEPVEQKQAKEDYEDKRNQYREYKECMGLSLLQTHKPMIT